MKRLSSILSVVLASVALVGCGDVAITTSIDAAWSPPSLDGGASAEPLVLEPLGDLNLMRTSASPSGYFAHAGEVFFGAQTGEGWGLFATDGSADGTRLVATRTEWSGAPTPQIVFEGRLVFSVPDDYAGTELWTTDGTDGGTALLADAAAGSEAGFVRMIGVMGSAFYFIGAGNHLWRSAGTRATTAQVGDVTVRPPILGASVGGPLVFEDSILFASADGDEGSELWTSDGTEGGTVLVADINPGAASSTPSAITRFGDEVLFYANDGTHGVEPWITDGTAAGTRLVSDINPGAGGTNVTSARIHTIDAMAYLDADDGVHGVELWRTDGTSAGTVMVRDLMPGPESATPTSFTTIGRTLLFVALAPGVGREPHLSDGTAEGTRLLLDIGGPATTSSVHAFAELGDVALFAADDGVHGRELWRTDGTAAGTVLVADVWPGPASGIGLEPVHVGGRVYFTGSDGTSAGDVFVTEGSRVRSLSVQSRTSTESSAPDPFVKVGARVIFTADDGEHGRELWGHEEGRGARLLTELSPGLAAGAVAATLLVVDDVAYFAGIDPEHGTELWVTDGTPEGTRLVRDLAPGPANGIVVRDPLGVVLAGKLYFFATDGEHGYQLWSTDGTGTGTEAVSDSLTSLIGSTPFGSYSGVLLFSAYDADGAGTFRLSASGAGIERLTATNVFTSRAATLGGTTLLGTTNPVGRPPAEPTGIYRTDGTRVGTVRLNGHHPTCFAELDGRVGYAHAGQLFVLDEGTATRVVGVAPILDFVPFHRALYFMGGNGIDGLGLWRTDLTAEGTELVRALGTTATRPVQIADQLVFWASDAHGGVEVWASDGTGEGTRRLADIYPGTSNSTPRVVYSMSMIDGALYLGLNDGQHGDEPWRLRFALRR